MHAHTRFTVMRAGSWQNIGMLCAAVLCCGGLPLRLHAAETITPPPPPTAEIVTGPWTKVETFLRDPKNHGTPDTSPHDAVSDAAALPSLGHAEIFSGPIDLTPAAAHSVNFSAMPPMFERRRHIPKIEKPKAVAAPINVPPPIQPAKPAAPANCASPAAQAKQAKALDDDRATLHALRKAVQDLRLEKDLDFMMPQNTGLQQSTAAPTPNAPPEPTAP